MPLIKTELTKALGIEGIVGGYLAVTDNNQLGLSHRPIQSLSSQV
ncbi:hypothetical protein JCM19238_187 [Vibrio ponticus]|nr:hypothetical protein JCM19238_187 [Vibrio ponticus]